MTTALDLLAEAQRSLREDVAPQLSGETRVAVMLAANAVATAMREVALADRISLAEAAVACAASDIRNGLHDDDAALHARLLAAAVLRAHVADPAAPTADERRAFLDGGAA